MRMCRKLSNAAHSLRIVGGEVVNAVVIPASRGLDPHPLSPRLFSPRLFSPRRHAPATPEELRKLQAEVEVAAATAAECASAADSKPPRAQPPPAVQSFDMPHVLAASCPKASSHDPARDSACGLHASLQHPQAILDPSFADASGGLSLGWQSVYPSWSESGRRLCSSVPTLRSIV